MANIKPECFECTNVYLTNQSDWYCRKHREFIKFQNGCDDFWPEDGPPNCEMCRYFVDYGGEFGECRHSSMRINANMHPNSFCENWRAR